MRLFWFTACVAVSSVAGAKAPLDVPASHRARKAVIAMVDLKVMPAKDGKFRGDDPVLRVDLPEILVRFARTLDDGSAVSFKASPTRKHSVGDAWQLHPVTRYDVAEVLYRVGGSVANHRPANHGKPDLAHHLPVATTTDSVPRTSPAYAAVRELVRKRMVWHKGRLYDPHTGASQVVVDSVVLHPDNRPVTGAEFADAVSQLVAGYIDTHTAEPQNKDDAKPARPKARR